MTPSLNGHGKKMGSHWRNPVAIDAVIAWSLTLSRKTSQSLSTKKNSLPPGKGTHRAKQWYGRAAVMMMRLVEAMGGPAGSGVKGMVSPWSRVPTVACKPVPYIF